MTTAKDVLTTALGLHVICNPTGTYSFVGNVPANLGYESSPKDWNWTRAYRNAAGETVVLEFPTFSTVEEAITFAASKGHKVANR